MNTEQEKLYNQIKNISDEIEQTTRYIQNDFDRAIDDGYFTKDYLIELGEEFITESKKISENYAILITKVYDFIKSKGE